MIESLVHLALIARHIEPVVLAYPGKQATKDGDLRFFLELINCFQSSVELGQLLEHTVIIVTVPELDLRDQS